VKFKVGDICVIGNPEKSYLPRSWRGREIRLVEPRSMIEGRVGSYWRFNLLGDELDEPYWIYEDTLTLSGGPW
jgi:hypothetical protein